MGLPMLGKKVYIEPEGCMISLLHWLCIHSILTRVPCVEFSVGKMKIYLHFLLFLNTGIVHFIEIVFHRRQGPWCRLNIKMPFSQYRDFHVKDKRVSPTISSLTWKSPYLGKMVFILRQGPVYLPQSIPGNTRIQGISSHGFELDILKYYGCSIRGVNDKCW